MTAEVTISPEQGWVSLDNHLDDNGKMAISLTFGEVRFLQSSTAPAETETKEGHPLCKGGHCYYAKEEDVLYVKAINNYAKLEIN